MQKNTKVMEKFPLFKALNMQALLMVILMCTLFQNGFAQSPVKVSIPAEYLPSAAVLAPYRQEAANAKSSAYDLTKSLPQGYVTDGSVDYTQNLQQGINANSNIVFPNFPVRINPRGLSLKSNMVVLFGEKSELVLQPNEAPAYQMLGLKNLENVKIYFPVLIGDKDKHTGTKGEWGMGINIDGSLNIQIIGPKVSDCWGDGIYLGKTSPAINRNIDILYAQLDNNRRNGVSIICSNGLNIVSALVTNTHGTPPMAGIDIEPNDNSDEINNINIKSAITLNNDYGIIVELDRLSGQKAKEVNVNIIKHLDEGSKTGLCYLLAKPNSNAAYSGTISVINPIWKHNEKGGFVNVKSPQTGLNLKFSNVKVYKKDDNGNDVSDDSQLASIKNVMKKDLNADVK
jgi:hypothetical protein